MIFNSASRSSTIRLTILSWSASCSISSSKYSEAKALARFCRSDFSILDAKLRRKWLRTVNNFFQKAKINHTFSYKMQ